jgi:hypothetical protein
VCKTDPFRKTEETMTKHTEAVMVRERPILFSAPMVRAILEGRKTQTRRVIEPQPMNADECYADLYAGGPEWAFWLSDNRMNAPRTWLCPYGVPGDRLWVRETFQPIYGPESGLSKPNWKTGYGYQISYVATDGRLEYIDSNTDSLTDRCKPAIFMPRWASRITLEITKVSAERVQDITNADAEAEGMTHSERVGLWTSPAGNCIDASLAYRYLWDAINAKRGYGWDVNPWVWVIEFNSRAAIKAAIGDK